MTPELEAKIKEEFRKRFPHLIVEAYPCSVEYHRFREAYLAGRASVLDGMEKTKLRDNADRVLYHLTPELQEEKEKS